MQEKFTTNEAPEIEAVEIWDRADDTECLGERWLEVIEQNAENGILIEGYEIIEDKTYRDTYHAFYDDEGYQKLTTKQLTDIGICLMQMELEMLRHDLGVWEEQHGM